MQTEKFDGKVENAYGNPLPKPVQFSGEYQKFDTVDEIRTQNEYPTDEDIIQWANAKRKAAARAKATTAALSAAGIEPPAKDDPKVLTRNFINTLTLAGKSQDEAVEIARMALGEKFAQ